MFSLARASGAAVPFLLDTEMVLLWPLTLGGLGIVENHLLQGRSGPFQEAMGAVLAGDAKDQKYRESSIAEHASVDLRKVLIWLATDPGVLLSLWLCLRQSKDWGECARLVRGWNQTETLEFQMLRNQISGLDSMGDIEWATPESHSINENDEINWKKGFRAACEMGQCNLPDVSNLTLFQYRILLASEAAISKPIAMPKKQERQLRQRAHDVFNKHKRVTRGQDAGNTRTRY
jgi:hypothetical protein